MIEVVAGVVIIVGAALLVAGLAYAVKLSVDLHDTTRRSRAAMDALDTMRRPHAWVGWELLDELGISDIDGGRWQRAHVACERCGEERDVWKSIPRDAAGFALGCPTK